MDALRGSEEMLERACQVGFLAGPHAERQSHDAVSDLLCVGGCAQQMAVNLYFDRCPQVGGGSHGFGSELIDDVTLCEDAHRRNE